MKVNDISKVFGVYEAQPAANQPVKKAAAAAGKDKLMLSRDALDFQAVMKGLKEAPDARAGIVAGMSRKYEAGEHLADSRELAAALFKSGAVGRSGVSRE